MRRRGGRGGWEIHGGGELSARSVTDEGEKEREGGGEREREGEREPNCVPYVGKKA